MSATDCPAPLDLASLLAYWLGELDADDEVHLEEHLLACTPCADRLGELVRLGDGVRNAFVRGEVSVVLGPAFVDALAAAGWRLREYRVPANGSVHCTVAPEDHLSIARLQAPLAGVGRLDLVRWSGRGKVVERLRNLPFDPARGELLFVPAMAALRALHDETIRVELLDAGAGTDRVIARYELIHTAWKD